MTDAAARVLLDLAPAELRERLVAGLQGIHLAADARVARAGKRRAQRIPGGDRHKDTEHRRQSLRPHGGASLAGVPPWAQGYSENHRVPAGPRPALLARRSHVRGGILAPAAIHPDAIMLRSPFPGHRRYSITHRAVQRLRELVPTVAEEDDEALRDRLDGALISAEDGGKAVRTLDVMLAEPQILIPLESFGDTLYAIIKEDTVVTVLPPETPRCGPASSTRRGS